MAQEILFFPNGMHIQQRPPSFWVPVRPTEGVLWPIQGNK